VPRQALARSARCATLSHRRVRSSLLVCSTFSDVPGTLDGAYFGIPLVGWVQIMALIAALDIAVFRQVTHAHALGGQR
jgi:hypothetical protein